MNKWELILYVVAFIGLVGIFIPLLDSTYWLIRVQNYIKPFYLLLATVLVCIVAVLLINGFSTTRLIALILLFGGISHCIQTIFPYSSFYKKEIQDAEGALIPSLALLIFNVLQKNDKYESLLEKVKEEQPEVILLLETDKNWENGVQSLSDDYPFVIKKVQDDTYGMMLFSKHPFLSKIVRELYKRNIPSIEVLIEKEGQPIRIMCIHPEPPMPAESKSSKPKDVEIERASNLIDSRSNSELKILAGDLNDVAWSKSAKLLKQDTDLKDPRIGRGTFNTFPTNSPFKIPIDLLFCSTEFELIEMRVLENIGSDHHPFLIKLKFPKN